MKRTHTEPVKTEVIVKQLGAEIPPPYLLCDELKNLHRFVGVGEIYSLPQKSEKSTCKLEWYTKEKASDVTIQGDLIKITNPGNYTISGHNKISDEKIDMEVVVLSRAKRLNMYNYYYRNLVLFPQLLDNINQSKKTTIPSPSFTQYIKNDLYMEKDHLKYIEMVHATIAEMNSNMNRLAIDLANEIILKIEEHEDTDLQNDFDALIDATEKLGNTATIELVEKQNKIYNKLNIAKIIDAKLSYNHERKLELTFALTKKLDLSDYDTDIKFEFFVRKGVGTFELTLPSSEQVNLINKEHGGYITSGDASYSLFEHTILLPNRPYKMTEGALKFTNTITQETISLMEFMDEHATFYVRMTVAEQNHLSTAKTVSTSIGKPDMDVAYVQSMLQFIFTEKTHSSERIDQLRIAYSSLPADAKLLVAKDYKEFAQIEQQRDRAMLLMDTINKLNAFSTDEDILSAKNIYSALPATIINVVSAAHVRKLLRFEKKMGKSDDEIVKAFRTAYDNLENDTHELAEMSKYYNDLKPLLQNNIQQMYKMEYMQVEKALLTYDLLDNRMNYLDCSLNKIYEDKSKLAVFVPNAYKTRLEMYIANASEIAWEIEQLVQEYAERIEAGETINRYPQKLDALYALQNTTSIYLLNDDTKKLIVELQNK
ncbi:hypothetical protein [Kurthia sibirica]|uniref:Uncharacterized protein n=1 Tax=Kurthia sibirica TaxID=202750 RepID=A0A2U3AN74_9BACL|nr:hypothetical protein [Kurthia sibirica]PWI25982.1 hypothetical protein DEX24_05475 [Kurthia sibirica]GEK34985.1 hypothetical protein KSI01_25180 [Kurthia sibirica]